MDNPYKSRTRHLHKVEKLPGIAQAYAMVFKYSIFGSQSQSKENFTDEKMEKEIKRKAVKKIVELWELSEIGEKVLMKKWVEKEPAKIKEIVTDISKVREFWENNHLENNENKNIENEMIQGEMPEQRGLFDFDEEEAIRQNEIVNKSVHPSVEIIFHGKSKSVSKLKNIKPKGERVKIMKADTIKMNRLYLDVTEIDYKTYVKAYKDISLCRDKLCLVKTDMKKGAPESIDSRRATVAAELVRRGIRRKEIAEVLDFKIYSEDNPSGSYPLLHKYFQVGAQVRKKLDKLEKYLQAITGIK